MGIKKPKWIEDITDALDNPVGDFFTTVVLGKDKDNDSKGLSNEDMLKKLWSLKETELAAADRITGARIPIQGDAEIDPQVIRSDPNQANNTTPTELAQKEIAGWNESLLREFKKFIFDNKWTVDPNQYASNFRRRRG